MKGQRIPYPALALELVHSVNALAGVRLRARGGDEDGFWEVRPFVSCDAYDRRVTLAVRIGGSPQRVHLDPGAVEVAAAEFLAEIDFETLDGQLQAAVLEATLADPLRELGQLLRAEILLEGVEVADPGDERVSARTLGELPFEVRMPGDIVLCSVLLEVTSPLPPAVIEALAAFARPRDFGDLPVRVAFEVGSAELTPTELRSLAAGDIVLFDSSDLVHDRVRVNVGDQVWRMAELGEERVALAAPSPAARRGED